MSNGSGGVSIRIPSLSFSWVKALLWAAVGSLIYYAYCVQPVEGNLSCYKWLTQHWANVSNYSHGPLIPFIASFLMWWKLSRPSTAETTDWKPYWRALGFSVGALLLPELTQGFVPTWYNPLHRVTFLSAPFLLAWQVWSVRRHLDLLREQPYAADTAVLALAMAIYYVGVKAVQPRAVVLSLVVLLYGLALALGGRRMFRVLFFPITFLLLMIPLNFLDEVVGFPLRIFVAQASTALLNWLGIEATRVGSGIYSKVFQFDVADPCSGIRSLMALTTVTAAYGYVTQESQWKRWVLFLSAMPLAVLGNMARVISIAMVAQAYGQNVANSFHEWSGFILFPVALGAMVLLGVLLNFPYRRLWENWTRPIDRKMSGA